MRRSAMAWVQPVGEQQIYPVWHLWHQGRMYVVTGGAEQQLPPCERVVVVVRHPERPAQRAGTFAARVEQVIPGSTQWDQVIGLLHARRLNATDGEDQPARWARESRLLALTPEDEPAPGSGP